MNLIDLPDIEFVDTNPDTIRDAIISGFEALADKKLFPADPVRLFLLSVANIIVQQRVLINIAAKQNLLRYASGDVLDHEGARVETPRIEEQGATTTIRFTLSAPRPDVVAVPLGTRVTPGSNLYFASQAYAQILAGSLFVDVLCECLTAGVIGNGFVAGQITEVVDPFPWLDKAENITESTGGSEREDDDSYRERIHIAPEAFSVAGPEGAYEYHAKSADINIADVYVYSPSDGVVEIVPLMIGGALPAQAVLDAVLAKCSDKKVRPLTDHVQVVAPTQIAYDVNLSYWIGKENENVVVTIQAAVNAAITDYLLWQKSKLGRDINPSELSRRILNAGAKRAVINSPAYTVVSQTQVASDNPAPVIAYGGVENA